MKPTKQALKLVALFLFASWGMLFSLPIAEAHANLLKSSPAANSILPESPSEIRLWLSEPLEPSFSRISVRDQAGDKLDLPAAELDNSDAHQLFISLTEPLPDGVYLVIWQVVSTADGHPTEGSFTFAVGENTAFASLASNTVATPIPTEDTVIRWFNLLAMALSVGSVAFMLFVWRPLQPRPAKTTRVERYQWRLAMGSWLLAALGALALLLMQADNLSGGDFGSGFNSSTIRNLLEDTRFGELWLMRLGAWCLMGIALANWSLHRAMGWLALLLGILMLVPQTLNSHASAAQDATPSLLADFLHLSAAVLWLGGLVQLLNTLIALRRQPHDEQPSLAQLTLGFSNLARIAVIALIITGVYATWLQVGSWEALTDTTYGQALLVKLILFLPLLGIAGVNLVLTQRRLAAGHTQWGRHLTRLTAAEIVLAIGLLVAVGVMTSINPARTDLAARPPAPIAPEPQPIVGSEQADGLTIDLSIAPGWVGENTFSLHLSDRSGNPIENASLIRLRLENIDAGIAESEMQALPLGNGDYAVRGSNMASPGTWRLRITIQRPDEFDTVVDFNPTVEAVPPTVFPAIDPDAGKLSLDERSMALVIMGLVLMLVGGVFVGLIRLKNLTVWPSLGLVILGVVIFGSGLTLEENSSVASSNLAIEKIVIAQGRNLPYLITTEGKVYEPLLTGQWSPMALDARVRDLYVDYTLTLWVATDTGLYRYGNETWEQINTVPVRSLFDSHGFLFAIGNQGLERGPDDWRTLDLPGDESATDALVMTSDHAHVAQSGPALYISQDVGLSWVDMATPDELIQLVATDKDELIALTANGIMQLRGRTWRPLLPLPNDALPSDFVSYNGQVFAIVDGALYQQADDAWQSVDLPDGKSVDVVSLSVRRGENIWVGAANGEQLWSSIDGNTWLLTPIKLE